MPSFRTLRCARRLNVLVLGLMLTFFWGLGGSRSSAAQASTGNCELKQPEKHLTLISEMEVPKTPVDAVSPPRLLYAPDPEFPAGISEHDFSGRAVVALLVDVNGMPQQVHMSCSSLGAGFDENAVKAVKQYRFKPARLKGKPVPAKVSVEIVFQR